ncbi:hypothetical protein [Nonomuraea pusilla]|uniref:Uncharacterized protein n=1 Tax=Nonomuraea pusilla TaxID=46177 RepID=A0A1H8K251_9ACTN|nr:hypothetical protein [Nonomuraea pusilla]SEN86737.1 hypothetical protein SAMN05660976_08497 [Nonomuraea pusilla]
MTLYVDASDLDSLRRDLVGAAAQARAEAPEVVREEAAQVRKEWRANARRTAGKHGKHYPNSITMESREGAAWEIGPDSAYPQGGMGRGFEYGSVNQAPHLDGTKAAMNSEARLEQSVADWAEKLL